MSKNCETDNFCNREMEYVLEFTVCNLKIMEDGGCDEPEELLIVMSFDNNIFKFPILAENYKTFQVKKAFNLLCTPLEIFQKLKTLAVMFSISKGMLELGRNFFSLDNQIFIHFFLKRCS
jgi:hypothetical protein